MLVLTAGCGAPEMDYSQVDLVSAGGTVTLDGQPLPGAVVTFENAEGQFSYGLTDDSGYYELQFDSVKEGVTTGPKTVRISTTRKILGLNADDTEGGEVGEASEEGETASPAAAVEKVPAKYNKNSELKADVTSGQSEYNFDLTSA